MEGDHQDSKCVDHFLDKNLNLISPCLDTLLKFIYSEKATKFCEISTLLLSVCTVDKSKVEISQNNVAFSEYTNFILQKSSELILKLVQIIFTMDDDPQCRIKHSQNLNLTNLVNYLHHYSFDYTKKRGKYILLLHINLSSKMMHDFSGISSDCHSKPCLVSSIFCCIS